MLVPGVDILVIFAMVINILLYTQADVKVTLLKLKTADK